MTRVVPFCLVLSQVMDVIQGSTVEICTTLPSPFVAHSVTNDAIVATPDDLIQFTLEAMSLPSEARPSSSPDVFPQADIFQPMKAVLLFSSSSKSDWPSSFLEKSCYFQGTYAIQNSDGAQLSSVPEHLLTISTLENKEQGLIFCAGTGGNQAPCTMIPDPARVTAEVANIQSEHDVFKDTMNIEQKKKDLMMFELAHLRVLLAQIKETEASYFMDEYPDLVWVSLTSLSHDDDKEEEEEDTRPLVHLLHQALHDIVDQVNELAQNMVLMEILMFEREEEKEEQQVIREDINNNDNNLVAQIMRKLQKANSTDTNSAIENTDEATNLKSPSLRAIEEYQIILWTSISLVVMLLSTVCCLCNMPIGRDSLLYAKFQTDGSHRKMH